MKLTATLHITAGTCKDKSAFPCVNKVNMAVHAGFPLNESPGMDYVACVIIICL